MKSGADCDGSYSGADKIKMESVDVFTYGVTLPIGGFCLTENCLLVGDFYLQMAIGFYWLILLKFHGIAADMVFRMIAGVQCILGIGRIENY